MWPQKQLWSAIHDWSWTIKQWPNLDSHQNFSFSNYPRIRVGPWEHASKSRIPSWFGGKNLRNIHIPFVAPNLCLKIFIWKPIYKTPGPRICGLIEFWKALKYLPATAMICICRVQVSPRYFRGKIHRLRFTAGSSRLQILTATNPAPDVLIKRIKENHLGR